MEIAVREFSVFLGRFCAKQQVEQVAQISFENTSKAEFVDFGLDFGDLFRTLLRMKMQIIEQSQLQLGYLGGIILLQYFHRQRGKWQAGEIPTGFFQKLFIISSDS